MPVGVYKLARTKVLASAVLIHSRSMKISPIVVNICSNVAATLVCCIVFLGSNDCRAGE